MNCFIGLDIGTSAVKGVLLTEQGKILAVASKIFNYDVSAIGKFLNHEEFVNDCFYVIKSLAEKKGNNKIRAICPCGASGNLIFLDDKFNPYTPIISWQNEIEDEEFSSYYSDKECEEIYQTVGWPVINSFPIAYFPYIAKNKSNIIKNAKIICMSIEYLNYVLTGNFGISNSMATPFYLVDQERGVYDDKLLNKFGIKSKQLPPILPKGSILGTVKDEVADALELSRNVKVILGSFDHPSGATGAGVFDTNQILISCGTSWVLFFPLNCRSKAIKTGLLVDRFMINKTDYCVMKSIPSLSLEIEKLIKYHLGDISYKELDELIEKSKYGSNGLKFNFDKSDYSIADNYSKSDIARAIYESAARMLKQNLSECEELGLSGNRLVLVGGITNSKVCVKVISEVLQKNIIVINGVSAGAVGAAMLASIGIGMYKDEIEAFTSMNFETFEY